MARRDYYYFWGLSWVFQIVEREKKRRPDIMIFTSEMSVMHVDAWLFCSFFSVFSGILFASGKWNCENLHVWFVRLLRGYSRNARCGEMAQVVNMTMGKHRRRRRRRRRPVASPTGLGKRAGDLTDQRYAWDLLFALAVKRMRSK